MPIFIDEWEEGLIYDIRRAIQEKDLHTAVRRYGGLCTQIAINEGRKQRRLAEIAKKLRLGILELCTNQCADKLLEYFQLPELVKHAANPNIMLFKQLYDALKDFENEQERRQGQADKIIDFSPEGNKKATEDIVCRNTAVNDRPSQGSAGIVPEFDYLFG